MRYSRSCHFFISSFSRQPTSRKGQFRWTNGRHFVSLLSRGGNFCAFLLESCLISLPWKSTSLSLLAYLLRKTEKAFHVTLLVTFSRFFFIREKTDWRTYPLAKKSWGPFFSASSRTSSSTHGFSFFKFSCYCTYAFMTCLCVRACDKTFSVE